MCMLTNRWFPRGNYFVVTIPFKLTGQVSPKTLLTSIDAYKFQFVHEEAASRYKQCAEKAENSTLAPNQLLFQQKRFKSKINLKKPKVFYTRKVVNALVTPFFANPNKGKTMEDLCAETTLSKVSELGPYDKIIAKEIRNWFDKSRMTVCVHVNSISEEDLFPVKVALRRANMYYKRYGNHLLHAVLEDSPYKDLEPLISNWSAWIFSPDINVNAMEKILKKSYKLYPIGGVLDGYVLNHADFLKYGKLDMTTAQLGLVQLLQSAGGANLNRQLTQHQTTLVTRLEQIGANAKGTPSENEQSAPV